MHLVHDSTLHRHRTSLQLLLHSNADFHCLFKLAIVNFLLCNFDAAGQMITQAAGMKNAVGQKVMLWKGLILYYLLHHYRKDGFPGKRQEPSKYVA